MKTEAGIFLHNKFDFTLIDAKTKKVKGTYTSYNVVLNSFIDRIKGNAAYSYQYSTDLMIESVAVGTGTGDLSTSRTNLFTYKDQTGVAVQSIELLDQGINKVVYAGTFSETAAIGNLTEVGLCSQGAPGSWNWMLYTHSLITDSEGNPITIEKTDADILNVQATVYSKISVSGPVKFTRTKIGSNDRDMDDSKTYRFPADYTLDNSWYNDNWGKLNLTYNNPFSSLVGYLPTTTLIAQHLGHTDSTHWDYYAYLLGTTKPISHYDVPAYYSVDLSTPAQAIYYSDVDRLRIQTQLMASTKGNYPSTWLVKGIGFGTEVYGLWGYMSFPNHDIYPPKEFTFTLTGDGETTEFNLPIPEVMTEGVEIRINDAVVDSSNYTFSGKNFNMSQAWASTDNRYMVQTGLVRPARISTSSTRRSDKWVTPLFPSRLAKSTYAKYNEPIIYDFITPKKVNTFRMNNIGMNSGYSNNIGTFTLQYSNDGVTWLEVATKQLNSGENSFNLTFDVIEARYWRVDVVSDLVQSRAYYDSPEGYFIGVNSGTDPQTVLFCGFDYVEPGIKFNTPPAEGASITVTCKCEYPIMNSNWRVDPIIIDLNITRGENFSEV